MFHLVKRDLFRMLLTTHSLKIFKYRGINHTASVKVDEILALKKLVQNR